MAADRAVGLHDTAFRLEGIEFGYRHGGAATSQPAGTGGVFCDFNATIGAGQMLGVIGPNGSGKTTLLKLLAGIVRPRRGTVWLYDRDLSRLSRREIGKTLAYVPQDVKPLFPFTVQDIVLMGRYPHRPTGSWRLWGWERTQDYAVADHVMRRLDVRHLAEFPMTELSSGERQRAIIARALAQETDVILLDEPTAFLDVQYQLAISQVLRELVDERGLTIVLVSHDLNLASQYCHRLLLLNRGRVAGMDRPDHLLRPDLLESVYGCRVLVDRHPETGLPRVSLPGRAGSWPGAT